MENKQGWPKPCIYTMYDRIFVNLTAINTVFTPYMRVCMVLANPTREQVHELKIEDKVMIERGHADCLSIWHTTASQDKYIYMMFL